MPDGEDDYFDSSAFTGDTGDTDSSTGGGGILDTVGSFLGNAWSSVSSYVQQNPWAQSALKSIGGSLARSYLPASFSSLPKAWSSSISTLTPPTYAS